MVAIFCQPQETSRDLAVRTMAIALNYKKPIKRAVREALYWYPYRWYTALMHPRYARYYTELPEGDVQKATLDYFDRMRHIKPYWLTQ